MLRTGEVGVDEGARIAEGVRDAKVHRAGRVLRLSKTHKDSESSLLIMARSSTNTKVALQMSVKIPGRR